MRLKWAESTLAGGASRQLATGLMAACRGDNRRQVLLIRVSTDESSGYRTAEFMRPPLSNGLTKMAAKKGGTASKPRLVREA